MKNNIVYHQNIEMVKIILIIDSVFILRSVDGGIEALLFSYIDATYTTS